MVIRSIFPVLSFIVSFRILAADSLPTPPSVSMPYSTEQLLRSDGSPYTGKKGAYNVTLENNNSRPIRCIDATFNVTLDYAGAGCESQFISTSINIGNDKKILDIQPGKPFRNSLVGNAERLAFEKANPSDYGLEFCSREAFNKDFRCGFNCETENRMFDEKWDERITGGSRKFQCEATGIKKRTIDAVACDTGFLKDLQNDRCIPDCKEGFKPSDDLSSCVPIKCEGNVDSGTYRVTELFNGTFGKSGEKREMCTKSGSYDAPTYTCLSDFRKEGESGCVHKSSYPEYYLKNFAASCSNSNFAISSECQEAATNWCKTNYGYKNWGSIFAAAGNTAAISCTNDNSAKVKISKEQARSMEPGCRIDMQDDWGNSMACQKVAFLACKSAGHRSGYLYQGVNGITAVCSNDDPYYVPFTEVPSTTLKADTDNLRNEVTKWSKQPSAVVPSFYRQKDQLSVYFQFSGAGHCHVQNMDQMSAYGGFDRVQIVSQLNLGGGFTGKCGWPAGFYRKSNEPAVYRIYQPVGPFSIGTQICHVTDEAQLARYGGFDVVKVISPDSDLNIGQTSTGSCAG